MDSFPVSSNFLQILGNTINDSLEKAAEKRGMPVQELIMVFQQSGWQKDTGNNKVQPETIPRKLARVTKVRENKADNKYNQDCLAYAS